MQSRNSAAPARVPQSQACARTYAKPSPRSRHSDPLWVARRRAAARSGHDHRRDQERGRVDEEGGAHAEQRDQQATQGRAGEPHPQRLHQLAQRVGLEQLVARHHLGHDRREGGLEQRLTDAVYHHQQDTCQRSAASANASAAIAPMAAKRIRSAITSSRRRSKRSLSTPASSRPATCGSVHAKPHDRERARLVRDVVDEPRDRDQVDPVADERDGLPGPEQPEVAVSQRAKHRAQVI